MPIRFITYSRVGMQRLGLVAAAVGAASDRQPMTLDGAAARLLDLVTREVALPESQLVDFEAYLNGLRLWQRYGRLKKEISAGAPVQLEDLWLSDPTLPRATGAATPENASELVQLAVDLRLLRDESHTRTDRGRALLAALGDRVAAVSDLRPVPNPLRMGFPATILLAAALIEADGDFLQSLLRTSTHIAAGNFTRADLSRSRPTDERTDAKTNDLAEACTDFTTRMRQRARSGAEQQILARAREWLEAVKGERGVGSDWGGGRPPEQLVTLRIEPWVDLGLITADSRYAYRYSISDTQRAALDAIASAADTSELSSARLVTLLHEAAGRPLPPRASADEAWEAIREAYATLRSTLGFAAFVEVVLLASGRLADRSEEPRLLELADGVALLRERRRQFPKDVRIGINRGGVPTYMKLSEGTRAT